MQPELLCPRRSRFAPKTQRWEMPIFEFRNPNSKIQNRVEGYVKEQFCLKFKQFQVFCQIFYRINRRPVFALPSFRLRYPPPLEALAGKKLRRDKSPRQASRR